MRNQQVTFHVHPAQPQEPTQLTQVATFVHPKEAEANSYQPVAGRQQCEMLHTPPPQYAHVVDFSEMIGSSSAQQS